MCSNFYSVECWKFTHILVFWSSTNILWLSITCFRTKIVKMGLIIINCTDFFLNWASKVLQFFSERIFGIVKCSLCSVLWFSIFVAKKPKHCFTKKSIDFVKSYISRILIQEASRRTNKLDNFSLATRLLGRCKQKYSYIEFSVLKRSEWIWSLTKWLPELVCTCRNMDEFKVLSRVPWDTL